MRVLFTGGSGKAGRHVVPYLVAQWHKVLNFDQVPLGLAGAHDRRGDICDAGQVYSAMRTHAGYDEMEEGAARLFDAVVHFAAVPRYASSRTFACRGRWESGRGFVEPEDQGRAGVSGSASLAGVCAQSGR